MLTDRIETQSFAVRVLKTHLAKKRLAHTYLFTGKDGAGHEGLALAFACALNCPKENFFRDCGCPSCYKTENRNHPDVIWLGEDPKARSIKIEEARQSIEKAFLKPFEGLWKVFILVRSERLTTEAANALLKTLEEPPAHTIFVLLAETKAHLLETIQSRGFEIKLRPLEMGSAGGAIHESLVRSGQNWLEYFEPYHGASREEIKELCDLLMMHFRNRIESNANVGARHVAIDPPATQWRASPLLAAIDRVIETKDAVDANANTKLALTRLTTQLEKILPSARV